MSEDTSMLSSPVGVPAEAEVEALLRKGKAQSSLTQDDVLNVFKTEAALDAVMETSHAGLVAGGIVVEEGTDEALNDEAALGRPAPVVAAPVAVAATKGRADTPAVHRDESRAGASTSDPV